MTMARRQLRETGTYLMAPAELNACLGVDPAAWHLFGAHWDELVPDHGVVSERLGALYHLAPDRI